MKPSCSSLGTSTRSESNSQRLTSAHHSFQEFDLTTEAMVRYSPFREDQWRIAIEAGLGERADLYEKVRPA